MKLGTIRLYKYGSYTLAGIGQIATGTLVLTQGDSIKQGFHNFSISTAETHLSIVWIVSALIAIYFPLLARHFQGLQDRYRLTDPAFVKTYREGLATAINDLVDIRAGRKAVKHVERGLLRTMVSIVRYYQGIEDERAINANLMLPLIPNPKDCPNIRFLETQDAHKLCRWVLKIVRWARQEPDLPPGLCLPVYDPEGEWSDKILPGAPMAFITQEPVIIDNTGKFGKTYLSGVAPLVQKQIEEYFESHKKTLRSFASIPAISGTEDWPVAIVNLQWNKKRIFGKTPQIVIDLLVPFVLVLAHVRQNTTP